MAPRPSSCRNDRRIMLGRPRCPGFQTETLPAADPSYLRAGSRASQFLPAATRHDLSRATDHIRRTSPQCCPNLGASQSCAAITGKGSTRSLPGCGRRRHSPGGHGARSAGPSAHPGGTGSISPAPSARFELTSRPTRQCSSVPSGAACISVAAPCPASPSQSGPSSGATITGVRW